MNHLFTNKFELLLLSIGLFIVGLGIFISSIFIKPFDYLNMTESLIYITGGLCIQSIRKKYIMKQDPLLFKLSINSRRVILLTLILVTLGLFGMYLFYVGINKRFLGQLIVIILGWIVIIYLNKKK